MSQKYSGSQRSSSGQAMKCELSKEPSQPLKKKSELVPIFDECQFNCITQSHRQVHGFWKKMINSQYYFSTNTFIVSLMKIDLTLERHGLELCGST